MWTARVVELKLVTPEGSTKSEQRLVVAIHDDSGREVGRWYPPLPEGTTRAQIRDAVKARLLEMKAEATNVANTAAALVGRRIDETGAEVS